MVVANDGPEPTADAVERTASRAPSRPAGGFVHLKTRAEFVHAAKGARFHTQGFSLQAAANVERIDRLGSEPLARFGFTVTKKTAGAVGRNRIRRRLREATRAAALSARPGYDYVLVGRPEAADAPFTQLVGDLVRALDGIHRRRAGSRRNGPQDTATPMGVRPADAAAVKRLAARDDGPTSAVDFGQEQFGKDQ